MSAAMLMPMTYSAPKRPADRDRHGIDQRAVEEIALANAHRLENAGQRVGRAYGEIERAALQPDFMARSDLGRDRREGDGQILDQHALNLMLERGLQAFAADQAHAGEGEVHQREDAPLGQRAGEGLDLVELAGGVATADDRADRGARDHVGHDSVVGELSEHADMRPAAGRARAQRQANLHAARRARAFRLARGRRRRISATLLRHVEALSHQGEHGWLHP